MAQAKIDNHTACETQVLFVNDEEFRPIVASVIKATFDISAEGKLAFAKEQVPVNLEGEFYADPETSSYKFEPEVAFFKPATDVVVLGDAVSSRGPVTKLLVDIMVGTMQKRIAVFGHRRWLKQAIGYVMSEPEPFETMPLVYENAFGGWDKRHKDPTKHGFEPRNTVGKGYYEDVAVEEAQPLLLPNLENPEQLINSITDRPSPAGCGFTLPHWQPRASKAGTYDQAWEANRNPLLPEDFERSFFNAASEGLVANGYLQGNEVVAIRNMTSSGNLQFNLPGVRAPVCEFELRSGVERRGTVLDTVIVDVANMQLQLIWRNYLPLSRGPRDVTSIDIRYG